MDHKTNEELGDLIEKATAGDKESLETLITGVRDLVFSLSLRMLGSFADAEDATQDILLKMMNHLSSFRRESSFTTWVYRIAANLLKNYKKHMFAHYPLSFEYYGNDIENGKIEDVPDLTQNVEQDVLAEELKMSCANVMLQYLDTESRRIFVLGIMFKVDSRVAGDILGITPTPEAYRQKLSRTRKKMSSFLEEYCGEFGSGRCRCKDRVNYAIQSRRLNPGQLEYTAATEIEAQTITEIKDATSMVRDYLSANPGEWDEIIHAPDLREHFAVQGSALKNVPAGYDKDHPQAQFLKYKSWYLEYPIKDSELLDGEQFLAQAVRIFELMKPFNDYLNRALKDFRTPGEVERRIP